MADVLRHDQPPVPDVDELAAIRALFGGNATKAQQARFLGYLLKMCGEGQPQVGRTGEDWAFIGAKRWVAATLMSIAEVRMIPLHVRNILETENV